MNTVRTGRFVKLLTALVLVLFSFLIFAQAEKKFTLDELDFPLMAKATSETGIPIYYRGEATAHHLGLYHPPLYIYALAAQIKVFGFSEGTVRAFGTACALLTVYLTLLLSRNWLPDRHRELHVVVFLAYIPHADIVTGTRTVEQLRAKNTQLSTFMFYGNIFVGKLLEIKHLGNATFSDVGTTYKACRSDKLRELLPRLDSTINLEFNPYFLDEALTSGLRILEAPVTFTSVSARAKAEISTISSLSSWESK